MYYRRSNAGIMLKIVGIAVFFGLLPSAGILKNTTQELTLITGLGLALSNGPNGVGVYRSLASVRKQILFPKCCGPYNTGGWTESEYPLIPSAIHSNENHLESV